MMYPPNSMMKCHKLISSLTRISKVVPCNTAGYFSSRGTSTHSRVPVPVVNSIINKYSYVTNDKYTGSNNSNTTAVWPPTKKFWHACSNLIPFGQYSHYHTSNSCYCEISKHVTSKRKIPQGGPGLEHFIANSSNVGSEQNLSQRQLQNISHPYVSVEDMSGHGRTVYFDVYGCQMNVNDTEIAWSILKNYGYDRTTNMELADVVLVMTCSIREGAEDKVWNKLSYLRGLKNKRKRTKNGPPVKVGVLGCMAERLKKRLLEQERSVDVVAGPDSYRDLPRLLALVDNGESAVNVLLSMEETYADIMPVSISTNRISAYVSIMRGCDNMCTYCIVPFTRGRERSRDIESIVEEVRYLSDQGVKEVTLLGQNVNSYRDTSQVQHSGVPNSKKETQLVKGFKTIYKPKKGGLRFADLLDKVSRVDPEMRIRFTSPHPKDFPDEVLYLIRERHNICNNLHLPAQCGSSRVLELMRRGYTKEAYLDLVSHIRSIIPNVSLSSDFICGFCSETEEEFMETLDLMEQVKYNVCYLFPYSVREKTHAHRRLSDDVPQEVKNERLKRMVEIFRTEALKINRAQIGQVQAVLVEGESKRSKTDLVGRNDGNTKVVFPNVEVESCTQKIEPGNYVLVKITEASSQVLKGVPLSVTSLVDTAGNSSASEIRHAI